MCKESIAAGLGHRFTVKESTWGRKTGGSCRCRAGKTARDRAQGSLGHRLQIKAMSKEASRKD